MRQVTKFFPILSSTKELFRHQFFFRKWFQFQLEILNDRLTIDPMRSNGIKIPGKGP